MPPLKAQERGTPGEKKAQEGRQEATGQGEPGAPAAPGEALPPSIPHQHRLSCPETQQWPLRASRGSVSMPGACWLSSSLRLGEGEIKEGRESPLTDPAQEAEGAPWCSPGAWPASLAIHRS